MKVNVDIQAAVAQRAGVGRYARMLVEHLGALRENDELSYFYFDFKPDQFLHQTVIVVSW